MKRLAWVAAVLAAIAALTVGVKRVWNKGSNIDPSSAKMIPVTKRDIGPVVKARGVIKPMVGAEVRVGSNASGVVTHLYVRIGDYVEKGTVLADVDSRELDARPDTAEAAVRLAKADLAYAQTDLHRKQELFSAQVIARSELALAQQVYAVAGQQYQQTQANLPDAVTQLGYTRIVAPISGTVESVSTQEGETVASSFAAPTFVTLLDLPPISSASTIVPQITPVFAVPVLDAATDFLLQPPGSGIVSPPNRFNDVEANIVLVMPTASGLRAVPTTGTGAGLPVQPNNVIPFDIAKNTASLVNWGDSINSKLLSALTLSVTRQNTVPMSAFPLAGSVKVTDVEEPGDRRSIPSISIPTG